MMQRCQIFLIIYLSSPLVSNTVHQQCNINIRVISECRVIMSCVCEVKIYVQMVMRCDCDVMRKKKNVMRGSKTEFLQTSPYSILAENVMCAISQASRIRNVAVVVVVKSSHFIVLFKKISVAVSIQGRLNRVPTGVYPGVRCKVIIDPVWVRRIRSR
jgi:hypothetical protein